MKIQKYTVLSLLIGFFWLGSCQLAAADMLIIPGTGDSQLLLRELGEAYKARSGHTVVVPESVGSSGGIRQVQRGQAALGRVARKLSAPESNLQWKQFAYAPVVFALHAETGGVDNLTSRQVKAIFTGEYQNWEQLGGGTGKIYVAQRESGDSSRTLLAKYFPLFAETDQLAGETLFSTPEMVMALDRYEGAVGYLPLSAIAGSAIRSLRLDGVAPTAENIRNGSYPLVIPLALVWKDDLDDSAASFVDFLFSSEASAVMRRFGVVPVEE